MLANGAKVVVSKSECLFNCLSGVFGACIMHSYFNNLISDIICFYYIIRPGSLILSFVPFCYALVCVCFSSLKRVWAMFLGTLPKARVSLK